MKRIILRAGNVRQKIRKNNTTSKRTLNMATPSSPSTAAIELRNIHNRNDINDHPPNRRPRRQIAAFALISLAVVVTISFLSLFFLGEDEEGVATIHTVDSSPSSLRKAGSVQLVPSDEFSTNSSRDNHDGIDYDESENYGQYYEHEKRLASLPANTTQCNCTNPAQWTAQAGQDKFVYNRIFSRQKQWLCCNGTFVEFGARNGIDHSNTYPFEKFLGWRGLLFEVDSREYQYLKRNRPGAKVIEGPVCPSYQASVEFLIHQIPGWSGVKTGDVYEPSRLIKKKKMINATCYHLATELKSADLTHVDYMTIDTEGSELLIVQDFPWEEFDIRVVQIEQLNEASYPAQAGKKQAIVEHMTNSGYRLLKVYEVAFLDTDDLIFVKDDGQLAEGVGDTASDDSENGTTTNTTSESDRNVEMQNAMVPDRENQMQIQLLSIAESATDNKTSNSSSLSTSFLTNSTRNCNCSTPIEWTAQSGQDKFVYNHIFAKQNLCCNGTFVEFGARNGIEHSNTYPFETFMGWHGLLFEMDDREFTHLKRNRPNSQVVKGPVCPSYQTNVSLLLSDLGGLSGIETGNVYEPSRLVAKRETVNATCYHLATELRNRNMTRVDYMTMDTEGSEQVIVEDFPWKEFDVRVVQIEQLNESMFPAQVGKKQAIIDHMTKSGYRLVKVHVVALLDTDDLIFVRDDDETSRLNITSINIGHDN
mmetsp:Transcript_1942/g.4368  ORF Transcript_1942/g.4368 Transcript_1942/m.4368 type:complete len:704 (+) Transcript_1942:121-2232(+)